MKQMKRIISLLLVAALLVSALPVTALAAVMEEKAAADPAPAVSRQDADSGLTPAASEFEAPISGAVRKEDGTGLADVTVALFEVTDEGVQLYLTTKTDAAGAWSVEAAWIGETYLVSYYKAGYECGVHLHEAVVGTAGVVLETVTAVPMEIPGLVCREADFEYEVDTSAETAAITGYTGTDGAIQLPETLGGYPVTAIADDAFAENTGLKTVVFSGSVASIGSDAFSGCVSLSAVYLPNTLTSIGARAFLDCTALAGIALPDSVAQIDGWAFEACTALSSINYPMCLTDVGDDVYYGCSSLVSISVPAGVRTLADNSFCGAPSLADVELPDTLTAIGRYAFGDCVGLETISVPIGVTEIGSGAFSGCTGLKSVDMPADLTTIGSSAFAECTSLERIVLPDGVTTIDGWAFENCTNLSSINYPLSLTDAGSGIFYGCENLLSITIPEGVRIVAGHVFDGAEHLQEVVLPETLLTIGTSAFLGCESLASMDLPDSITEIGGNAFRDCTGLRSVDMPENLLAIGNSAFAGCTGLESIILPDGVANIDGWAFENCTNLSSINYPLGLTNAGRGIFYGCESLTAITVPEGVTELPGDVFSSAAYLVQVTLPESLTAIGGSAFLGCAALKTITLPDGVTEIENNVFSDCVNLKSVELPENLQVIGNSAFSGCTGLKSIHLPDSVTTINGWAFEGCVNLSSVHYPLSLTDAGTGIFYGCESLTSVTVPEGVTELPDYVFSSASGLKYVTLPDSLERVGDYAFSGCSSLVYLILPEQVTAICRSAFSDCIGLQRVWIGEHVTEIDESAFEGCAALTIHGVAGSAAEAFASEQGIPFSTEQIRFDNVSLSGVVTDANGNGMEHVSVSVFDLDSGAYLHFNMKTDANGTWNIADAIADHNYLIQYDKPGYTFSANDIPMAAAVGGVVLETVTAVPLEIPGLVCREADFTYEVDTSAETAAITGYTGTDAAIQLPETLGGYPVTAIADDAFAENTGLETVMFPGSVTSIGNDAFVGCENLSAVYLPVTLTTIGSSAFAGCTGLESIDLPDRLTTINGWAFESCTNLRSVNYPLCLGDAGSSIFYGCESLTAIIVPEGVRNIAANVFDDAAHLREVVLPETLLTIGDSAFQGCTALESIDLPDSVTEIGGNAFRDCTGLRSVDMPENLLTIGNSAFAGCTGLESIILPDGVTTINGWAFENCSNLSSINYPLSLTNADRGIFYGCESLTAITVPEGVTELPGDVFSSAAYLVQVTLPESLTAIGGSAFLGCAALKSITLPDGVTEIENNVFSDCVNLKTVELPENLQVIGNSAFAGCTGLKSIDLPDSVTTIDSWAFEGCVNLSSIHYPVGLTDAGTGIFYGCESLTSVTVPEGVTELPDYVFSSASGLRYVTIPDSLERVGDYAFSGCSSLLYLILPEQVTAICRSAFSDCIGLQRIWIGEHVTEIDESAFEGCTALTIHGVAGSAAETFASEQGIPFSTEQIRFDNVSLSGVVTDANGNGMEHVSVSVFDLDGGAYLHFNMKTDANGAWNIADAIADHNYLIQYDKPGYTFSANDIPMAAAVGGVVLETVTAQPLEIPGLVCREADFTYEVDTSAETAAITGYTGTDAAIQLPEILGGYPVTSVGDDVFRDNTTLKTVVFSGSVTVIGNDAFVGCDNLSAVYLPVTLTTIGSSAFAGCTGLESIDLPDGVTTIRSWAFEDCTNLRSVHYPLCLDDVGGSIFYGCESLVSITIPEGVRNIAANVFDDAAHLREVVLPESLLTIGDSAFQGCTALASIDLPDSVTEIGGNAFRDCTGLRSVDMPENLLTIGNSAFAGCTGLESIVLPDGVANIDGWAFENCTNLSSINYPLGLTNAGRGIFYGCESLTAITVPEGVTELPGDVFSSAAYLVQVTLPESLTAIGGSAFLGCTALKSITLPDGVTEIGGSAFSECVNLKSVELPETLQVIGNSAFAGCTGLKSIHLPDSVATISGWAFENCTNLRSVNYPRSLADTGSGIFYGCEHLTSMTVPEGVTELPAHVFSNATALRAVSLPVSLKTVGASAFHNCDQLRYVALSGSVDTVENNAFSDCSILRYVSIPNADCQVAPYAFEDSPNLQVYCKWDSEAALCAMRSGVFFRLLPDGTRAYSGYALDMDQTEFYTTDSVAVVQSKTTMALRYSIPEAVYEELTQPEIEVYFPTSVELSQSTVALDDRYITGFEYEDYVLKIPVTAASGTIRFDVVPTQAGLVAARAQMNYIRNGADMTDMVGMIYLDAPMMALSVSDYISRTTFDISGVAAGGSIVLLSIDGVQVGRTAARKDGSFSTTISFPTEPVSGTSHTVTAVQADNSAAAATATVTYLQSAPYLTCFLMRYEDKTIDLLNAEGSMTNSINPGHGFIFDIAFENPESIGMVYVVSNKNGVKSTMEAKPTENAGEYRAQGYFSGMPEDYLPGEINVYYTRKTDPAVFNEPMKREDMPAIWQTATSEVLMDTEDAYLAQITLGNGVTGTFESRKNLTIEELYEQFLPDDGSAQVNGYQTHGAVKSILDFGGDLLENYGENVIYNIDDVVDGDYVYMIADKETDTITYIIWEPVLETAVSTTIRGLASWYVESGGGLTAGEASAGVGMVFDIGKTVIETSNTLIDLDIAENTILASDRSEAEKAAMLERLDQVRTAYVGLAVLRCAGSVVEFALATSGHPVLAYIAGIVFDLAHDFMKDCLEDYYLYQSADGKKRYLKWLLDPSGYVYDALTQERLGGVTVTAYWIEYDETDAAFWDTKPASDDYGTLWNAAEYSQENPLTTDSEGRYAWDVPTGWWRVRYEKTGYETTWSDWMQVPPPQTEVNIGMTPVESTVTYTSASISLAGDIGVNYYAQLSGDIVADEGAYMQFTVAGQTQIVPLEDAVTSTGADGSTTYRFSCKVAAKQMTEQITGQMYLGDGTAVGEAKVYSVKAYCDAAIPVYSQYAAYADLVELMEAMLNYGGYSQTHFGYNTANLANAGLDTTLPAITAADVDPYTHGATGSESGIGVASVSLLLESTTTIRFYFKLDGTKSIDEYTFYVDGVETVPVESNGQYYVDKVNVAAKDLDEMVTVTVGGLTAKYCGLSYVRQVAVLYPNYYSAALVNVAKALYAYNQAANAYFG